MLYVGVIYAGRYYSYFHLSPFAIGISAADFMIQSTQLLRGDVAVFVILVLVAISIPASLRSLPLSRRLRRRISAAWSALVRYHLVLVAAGLAILVAWLVGWDEVYPYDWLAFVLIAGGLLLGLKRAVPGGVRPRKAREKGVAVSVAVLFLVWAVTLIAQQLGEQQAERDAQHIEERSEVVVLSTQRLSLHGPRVSVEDLGESAYLRYRYTGLRLLVARNDRYYVLPLGWNSNTSSTFIFRESDSTRIELRPGVQRP
jgi:hypothetical protein